jgi:hypothetical protein
MGIRFPPGTRFLLYHRASEEPGLLPTPDDAIHLKIELPRPMVAKFLEQSPLSTAHWQTAQRWVNDLSAWPEWKPGRVDKFRSARIELPLGKFLIVLIDEDRDGTAVVYLMWFET